MLRQPKIKTTKSKVDGMAESDGSYPSRDGNRPANNGQTSVQTRKLKWNILMLDVGMHLLQFACNTGQR